METEAIGTKLFAWGSAETDQFYISEEEFESKRPVPIDFFFTNNIKIRDVACGGQHTVLLSTTGAVFTLGSGDEGQLGREGVPNRPSLVSLDHLVDLISAGEAHSVAANSGNGILYTWGVMRNLGGNMSEVVREPRRTGLREFKGKKFTKVLSGNNHVAVLVEKKIFVWGDSETCVLGKMPLERRKNEQSLQVGGIGLRGVVDVFTGGYHMFAVVEKKGRGGDVERSVYGWGKNNWGQLGVGDEESSAKPKKLLELEGREVSWIGGGDDHTVAVVGNGELWGWGRNDDYQVGGVVEEEYREKVRKWREGKVKRREPENPVGEEESKNGKEREDEETRKKGEERNEREDKKEEEKADGAQGGQEIKTKEHKVETEEIDEGGYKEEAEEGEEGEVKMDTIILPMRMVIPEQVKRVYSSSHYNIAVGRSGQFYSWGLGFNYVLGNGKDSEVKDAYPIKPEFFKGEAVACISLGGNHVMFTQGPVLLEKNPLAFDPLAKISQPRLKRIPFPSRPARDVSVSIERKQKLKEKERGSISPNKTKETREH